MPGLRAGPIDAHHLALGRLDLDHLGAQIGEDLRRHRPQHRDRQIDHADSRQRSGHTLPR